MTNPFVRRSRLSPHTFTIGFQVPRNDSEPLWWVGEGFKDLARVNLHPEEFQTEEAARQKIETEVLEHIRKWRSDQVCFIKGWQMPGF